MGGWVGESGPSGTDDVGSCGESNGERTRRSVARPSSPFAASVAGCSGGVNNGERSDPVAGCVSRGGKVAALPVVHTLPLSLVVLTHPVVRVVSVAEG